MTTSTSRPAMAAPIASAWPARNRFSPKRSSSFACKPWTCGVVDMERGGLSGSAVPGRLAAMTSRHALQMPIILANLRQYTLFIGGNCRKDGTQFIDAAGLGRTHEQPAAGGLGHLQHHRRR